MGTVSIVEQKNSLHLLRLPLGGQFVKKCYTKQQPTTDKQKATYTVQEISDILGISLRSAYNLSNETAGFRVLRIGRTVRIHKESFDKWFNACVDGCQDMEDL